MGQNACARPSGRTINIARDHGLPQPDAATPSSDERWPDDHRDVVRQGSGAIARRIADIWNE